MPVSSPNEGGQPSQLSVSRVPGTFFFKPLGVVCIKVKKILDFFLYLNVQFILQNNNMYNCVNRNTVVTHFMFTMIKTTPFSGVFRGLVIPLNHVGRWSDPGTVGREVVDETCRRFGVLPSRTLGETPGRRNRSSFSPQSG